MTKIYTIARNLIWAEAASNAFIFLPFCIYDPEEVLNTLVVKEDAAQVTPLAAEVMRWFAVMSFVYMGVGLFVVMRRASTETYNLFMHLHLVSDTLYLGSVALWVHRTGHSTMGTFLNLAWGFVLMTATFVLLHEIYSKEERKHA
mmetsp:Transcript_24073/g.42505  ORF Transcript_24073/g.42505 Transcript_24073/m.42505 type:complete len:145 (+) Transcript_24073:134-568(+)